MPSSLIFLILFFVVDIILKKRSEKDKVEQPDVENTGNKPIPKSRTFADLVRKFEEQFEEQLESKSTKSNVIEETQVKHENKSEPRREGIGNESRDEWIKTQEAKIKEHSDFDKVRRLKRDSILKKARLGDSQVTLASKMPKKHMDDYDLDKNRDVSIKAVDVKEKETSKSGLLNIKEDILKGIIYSEILSKPKSLERK